MRLEVDSDSHHDFNDLMEPPHSFLEEVYDRAGARNKRACLRYL